MKCIHYGAHVYYPDKVKPVQNGAIHKPYGGLWVSPIDAEWGWKEWAISESWGIDDFEKYFIISIDISNVLLIDSRQDMERYLYKGNNSIDFEKLSKKYDAVHLTEKGEEDTRFSNPNSLYGWDCECIFIINKNIINDAR